MTTWTFRATWPITNPDHGINRLQVEACREVDRIAEHTGARILGDLRWRATDQVLIAEAPAMPRTRADAVRWLAVTGRYTDAELADLAGCSESYVAQVRARHKIPPGPSRASTPRRAA